MDRDTNDLRPFFVETEWMLKKEWLVGHSCSLCLKQKWSASTYYFFRNCPSERDHFAIIAFDTFNLHDASDIFQLCIRARKHRIELGICNGINKLTLTHCHDQIPIFFLSNCVCDDCDNKNRQWTSITGENYWVESNNGWVWVVRRTQKKIIKSMMIRWTAFVQASNETAYVYNH